MGIFSRFKRVLKAKLSKGLNRLEDPAEQLDYAYEELMGERKKIEKAIRDVTADKNMIATALNEHQEAADEAHSKAKRYRRKALQLEEELDADHAEDLEKVHKNIEKYNEAARNAMKENRKHSQKVQELQQKLEDSEQWLNSIREKRLDVKSKLEQVEMEKERLKSEWRMAQAESRIESTLSGLGSDVSDIDMTISRAKEKIKREKALASATRELSEEGVTGALETEGSEVRELEGTVEGLPEENFQKLDQEIRSERTRGPYLLVGITGGGTWALPEPEGEELRKEIDRVDDRIVELNQEGSLDEKKFNEQYSSIFAKVREEGLLVGRDLNLEEVSENEEVIPEPEIKLPPEDLEFEEATKMLEGEDLLSQWGEEESSG